MRTFKTLAIAALLTAGAMAQASAGNFDSFDLGSTGAVRQSQIDNARTNGALGANASANMPGKRMIKPDMSYLDHDSANSNSWSGSN